MVTVFEGAAHTFIKAYAVSGYCTAMVTVFEVIPPMVSTTGTALPAGIPGGTRTFT
jgi:short-subunit dehydrogenase involved in D-alanine esterification of teichoic acids